MPENLSSAQFGRTSPRTPKAQPAPAKKSMLDLAAGVKQPPKQLPGMKRLV